MTPIAHASAGYLTAQLINYINPSLGFDKPGIIIPVIIGATISDIDILFTKDFKNHRDSLLHIPFFWLFVLIMGYLFYSFFNYERFIMIIIGFGLGIFTHIFFDWLTVGEKGAGDIKLLFPFSNKKFSYKPNPATGKEYSKKYIFSIKHIESHMRSKFVLLEIFLIVISLLVFFLKLNIIK